MKKYIVLFIAGIMMIGSSFIFFPSQWDEPGRYSWLETTWGTFVDETDLDMSNLYSWDAKEKYKKPYKKWVKEKEAVQEIAHKEWEDKTSASWVVFCSGILLATFGFVQAIFMEEQIESRKRTM